MRTTNDDKPLTPAERMTEKRQRQDRAAQLLGFANAADMVTQITNAVEAGKNVTVSIEDWPVEGDA